MKLRRTTAAVALTALTASGLGALATAGAWAASNVAPVRVIEDVLGEDPDDYLAAVDVDDDGYLYVPTASSVRIFAPGASGQAAPVRVIAGDDTGLRDVSSVSVAADGRIFVSTYTASVLVFAADADGNDEPVRVIEGGSTVMTSPSSLEVAADGTVYVSDFDGRIVVFAPGADGDAEPVRVIEGDETGLSEPEDIALDSAGNLVVPEYYAGEVRVFAADADGDVAPIRTFRSSNMSNPGRLVLDGDDNVYLHTYGDDLFIYAAGSSGTVQPLRHITGNETRIDGAWGIALDGEGDVYLGDRNSYHVGVFTPFSKPSAAATVKVGGAAQDYSRTISWARPVDDGGSAVRYDVQVKRGSTTVATRTVTNTWLTLAGSDLAAGGHTVSVTAKNAFGAATAATATFTVDATTPGKVRKVKVKGKAKAKKRVVRWAAPAWDGRADVTGFRVVVKKGKKTLVQTEVKKSKLVLKRADLARGKHTVLVQAVNAKGTGTAVKATFKVKKKK